LGTSDLNESTTENLSTEAISEAGSRPKLHTPPAPGALVAVCGEPAAGKTVFLTCVFRTIDLAVKQDDLLVTFDREFGGASYFRQVEEEIATTGTIQGTQATTFQPCRLKIELRDALPAPLGNRLLIDLRDFAGRHFRAYADPREAMRETVEESARQVYGAVDTSLAKADAVIILIPSTDLDPYRPAGRVDPFTPSVVALINHCREYRVPIALLVSQADLVTSVTDEYVNTLPRVVNFKNKFTSDREEFQRGGRPFGLVRTVSCYSVDKNRLPVRLTDDGRFWREEPAETVLDLLRVALPQIRRKIEHHAHAEAKALKEEEDRRRREESTQAQRRRRATAGWFLAAFVLISIALGIYRYEIHKATQRRISVLRTATESVQQGHLDALSGEGLIEIERVIREGGGNDNEENEEDVTLAVRKLQNIITRATTRLLENPSLTKKHKQDIVLLLGLTGTLIEPRETQWAESVKPVLRHRDDFLSTWLESKLDPRTKLSRLDLAAKEAATLDDSPFSQILQAAMIEARRDVIHEWQQEIESARVGSSKRLSYIRELIPTVVQEKDLPLRTDGLSFLGSKLVWAIMDREDSSRLEDTLIQLEASLKPPQGGKLRFDIVAEFVHSCDERERCDATVRTLQELRRTTILEVESRRWLVEISLRELLDLLSPSEQKHVWESIARELEASYLFGSEPQSWPKGLLPLGQRLGRALSSSSDGSKLPLEQFLNRLALAPIYEAEIIYLTDLANVEFHRRQLVQEYKRILDQFASSSSYLDTRSLGTILNSLEGTERDNTFTWDTWPEPTKALSAEVATAISKLDPFTHFGTSTSTTSSVEPARDWLRARLSAHCAKLLTPIKECARFE